MLDKLPTGGKATVDMCCFQVNLCPNLSLVREDGSGVQLEVSLQGLLGIFEFGRLLCFRVEFGVSLLTHMKKKADRERRNISETMTESINFERDLFPEIMLNLGAFN